MGFALEKLRFMGRHGVGKYRRAGRRFFSDLDAYLEECRRAGREIGTLKIDPRTDDWNADHPLRKSVLEASYTAEQIRKGSPSVVHDIGSDQVFIATLCNFVPVVVVDTRQIDLKRPGLTFRQGDGRKLPLRDGECEFMTSLCVIEHLGLGRYGDSIDPRGDFKFVEELRRCLKPGGKLVLSMPVAIRDRLVFNAHRVYSPASISALTTGFSIVDEAFAWPRRGLLSRDEALKELAGQDEQYMIWIGCLERGS